MDPLIIAEKKGNLGVLSLNRPKALNAVDEALQQEIIVQLQEWENEQDIHHVLIKSSQARAFCAGGDIRAIYHYMKEGNSKAGVGIFHHNYQLIDYVHHYKKPVISVMDGITMGGGIGLGSFVPYRIVTEHSLLAMPEVMIGLTPDAGSNVIFGKAPGYTGLRAMLTGRRFQAEEAVKLGFADYIVPSSLLEELEKKLEQNNIAEILEPFKRQDQYDDRFIEEINQIYSGETIEEICKRLTQSNHEWAKQDLQSLTEACPFSLRVTIKAWRNKIQSLRDVLQQDLNLIDHLVRRADFLEGVRASVIDKDRNPQWNQDIISPEEIDLCFAEYRHLY